MNSKVFLAALTIAANITIAEASEDKNKWSLGATLGSSSYESSLFGLNKKRSADSFGLNLDYFVTENIAFGIGYIDFGKASSNISSYYEPDDTTLSFTQSVDVEGYTASALFQTNFDNSRWGSSIRVGLIDWEEKDSFKQTISGGIIDSQQSEQSEDGVDFYLGLGFTFDISDQLQLGLNTTWYDLSLDDSTFTSVSDDGVESTTAFQRETEIQKTGITLSYRF